MTFPTQTLAFNNFAQNQVAYNRILVSSGTTEFTVPDGVYSISGVVIGGGGGGNGSDGTGTQQSNGGGGGALSWATFSVLPGDILKLDIGNIGPRGGAADGAGGNGFEGGNSGIFLAERNGVDYRSSPVEIVFAEGGDGGLKDSIGGTGGQPNTVTSTVPEIIIYKSGGGAGGTGGLVASGTERGAGGGGAGGYAGNGGTGGGTSPTNPTAAATGSGGGGGGGFRTSNLGYGGGGAGSFGFDFGTQGAAGINDSSGGTGGSFFEDPGLGIRAEKIGETIAVTGPGITTIAIPDGAQEDDFLLLLSGSDKDSGLTLMPVPVGFTTFNQSDDGEYYTNYANYLAGTGTQIIAQNTPSAYQNRDLNFANSYQYIDDITDFPIIGGKRCVTDLTTFPAIHNLICLRYIPRPAQINWVATSGDPSINDPAATSMPRPPSVSGISSGSLVIALGYLANTFLVDPLNPPSIAPAGYTAVPDVADDFAAAPDTTSCVAAFNLSPSAGTNNPGAFLTGTASHSRAYTIELDWNSVGSGVQFVGYGTVTQEDPSFEVNLELRDINGNILPANTPDNGDLIVVATSSDFPGTPDTPNYSGGAMTTLQAGSSPDGRQDGNPGLGYGVWYTTYNGSSTISNFENDNTNFPAASLVMVFRNVDTVSPIQQFAVFDTDNLANKAVGAPDPPQLTGVTSGNAILIVGMVDDQKVSLVNNITPPTDTVDGEPYTLLSQASYGTQNNGLIIMSAFREDSNETTTPSSFLGNGANIWSSQTIVIGGPGSQTGGTSSAAGQYGGGGGGRAQNSNGLGMAGAAGAVRLIWGGNRGYPYRDGNTGNVLTVIDFTP
jgi:hypothetical protein